MVSSSSSVSFGDKAIDILFLLRYDGKGLSHEFVCDGDHGEFAGFPLLSESGVGVPALGIESACGHCRHIEESSGVGVTVTVDVPPYIDGRAGLLVGRAESDVSGDLLGVLEVSEATSGDDEGSRECQSYAFDGCEELDLLAELGFDEDVELFLKPVKSLVEAYKCLVYGVEGTLVGHGQAFDGAPEVGEGSSLLLELPYHGSLLLESHDGVAMHLERSGIHFLPVERDEPGIEDIRLDDGEHSPREVLYLERVLHAYRYPGGAEQVEQHRAVVAGGLHDAVDVRDAGESSDEFLYPSCGVVECACLAASVRGIGGDERSLADINSNVLHNNVTLTVNGIDYIVSLHCKCGVICPTNYPVSDVKSVGPEHIFRSAGPMQYLAYSTL